MIFFTVDTHYNHYNIIKNCNRPFTCVDDMNDTMIENTNSNVGQKDILYHLGNFAWRDPVKTMAIRNRIKCKNIHLVYGNHDTTIRNKYLVSLFSSVQDYLELKIDNKTLILCHYPFQSWNKARYGSIHLHGHCHGTMSKMNNRFDVGVDVMNFRPVSLDEILES